MGNITEPYLQYMYSYPHKTAYRSLGRLDLRELLRQLAGQENSLYVHIPFCQYKCGYCNLFSVAGQDSEQMEQYVSALERQASQFAAELPDQTVFADLTLGGGTPLILPENLLTRVFDMVEKYFAVSYGNCPVVVETSPNQTTVEKLRLLQSYHVTRLSIGVQSFHEKELKQLCRYHSPQTAHTALGWIKEMEFPCVNIDLIYGIPGQTKDSLLSSLKQAVSYSPQELFVYPLYVKEGTQLYKTGKMRGDNAAALYRCAVDYLKENGYIQLSMRRFVQRKEADSQRGVLCGFGNTLSIGCGGRSYLGALHICTPYAVGHEQCCNILRQYMAQNDYLVADQGTVLGYVLSREEQKRRYVVKHILFGNGIDRADYRMHFGAELQEDFPVLVSWCQEGYAVADETHIMLTEEGLALSDYLGPQFISPEVAERMKAWKQQME